MTQPNMMVYATEWSSVPTFRMLPVTNDCPFNEVLYDPSNAILAVISKDKKEKPQFIPKVNDKGEYVMMATRDGKKPVEERRTFESYYEYYITDKNDIHNFITTFAINPSHPSLAVIDTPPVTVPAGPLPEAPTAE